jgi:hypothetical protein
MSDPGSPATPDSSFPHELIERLRAIANETATYEKGFDLAVALKQIEKGLCDKFPDLMDIIVPEDWELEEIAKWSRGTERITKLRCADCRS